MSTLTDVANALWKGVLSKVSGDDLVTTVTDVIAGIQTTASGTTPSVLVAIGQRNPKTLKLIEEAADEAGTFFGGPLGGMGAELAVEIMSKAHAMTPDEERVWMDRQSSTEGQG